MQFAYGFFTYQNIDMQLATLLVTIKFWEERSRVSLPNDIADDHELNQPIHDADFLVMDVHYLRRVVLEQGGRRWERVAPCRRAARLTTRPTHLADSLFVR